MFGFNSNSVFKFVGAASAAGFLWFTFLSPETVNAEQKANYCLIAFFASLAVYYYARYSQECKHIEQDGMWRRCDEIERENSQEIGRVWDKINALESQCDDGACSTKRSR